MLDDHEVDAGTLSTEIIAYGDTLINNLLYKKMYMDEFDYFLAEETNMNWKNYSPRLSDAWENVFIRESNDVSKLYLYDAFEDKEYLISDLELQKGDIFYGDLYEATVDSVYYEQNLKHIQLTRNFDYYGQITTFIESVGPDQWFIYPHAFTMGFAVNCFQNQTLFYKNEGEVWSYTLANYPCGYRWQDAGNIPVNMNGEYTVSIKDEEISILSPLDGNVGIYIYDINGKLRYRKNTFSTNTLISKSEFPKGVYIMKILRNNKECINRCKIIL
jgi:hypothetical protein